MKIKFTLPKIALLCGVIAGLGAPSALALSTATATADLSFTVAASVGTLTTASVYEQQTAYVSRDLAGSFSSYNSGAGTASTSEGLNSATASGDFNAISSSSSAVLNLPPGYNANAQSYDQGQNYYTLSGYGAATNFTLNINDLTSMVSLDLATVGTGLYADAYAQTYIQIVYTTLHGGRTTYTVNALNGNIAAGDTYSDSQNVEGTFGTGFNIPTNFTSLYVYWESYVQLDAGDSSADRVPDGGTTALLLGLSFVGLGLVARRRKAA